jgi:hypothetical protein
MVLLPYQPLCYIARMPNIAQTETEAVIRRLTKLIEDDPRSLRELCRLTLPLDPPERIYHTRLSNLLRGAGDVNLYLQQFLALCKLLGVPALALLAPTDGMSEARQVDALVRRFLRLSREERDHLLGILTAMERGR